MASPPLSKTVLTSICFTVLVFITVLYICQQHFEFVSAGCKNKTRDRAASTATTEEVDIRKFKLVRNKQTTWKIEEKMDPVSARDIFDKFIFQRHYKCEDHMRLGNSDDGGWDICLVEPYRIMRPCLVYSFGINHDFSFDDAISIKFGCTVRSFDPSMGVANHRRGPNIWFYTTGIGGEDGQTSQGWRMRTLDTIVKELGDTDKIIDYLKMDVEHSEWGAMQAMFKSNLLEKRVKQFGFEIHISPRSPSTADLLHRWQLLTHLEEIGFQRWYWHLNIYCGYVSDGRIRSGCYEMVYINTRFMDHLANSTSS